MPGAFYPCLTLFYTVAGVNFRTPHFALRYTAATPRRTPAQHRLRAAARIDNLDRRNTTSPYKPQRSWRNSVGAVAPANGRRHTACCRIAHIYRRGTCRMPLALCCRGAMGTMAIMMLQCCSIRISCGATSSLTVSRLAQQQAALRYYMRALRLRRQN